MYSFSLSALSLYLALKVLAKRSAFSLGAQCQFPLSSLSAGAWLTENKGIPDGSRVMGAPGKVVRELDAAAIAGLTASAKHYQDNARRFASQLKPV